MKQMDLLPGPLLKSVDSPEDLKNLTRDQLQQLSDELRQYIIDVVSLHGGHFAAMDIPSAALMEVDECPTPNVS